MTDLVNNIYSDILLSVLISSKLHLKNKRVVIHQENNKKNIPLCNCTIYLLIATVNAPSLSVLFLTIYKPTNTFFGSV